MRDELSLGKTRNGVSPAAANAVKKRRNSPLWGSVSGGRAGEGRLRSSGERGTAGVGFGALSASRLAFFLLPFLRGPRATSALAWRGRNANESCECTVIGPGTAECSLSPFNTNH